MKYAKTKATTTSLEVNGSYTGESMEMKVRRILHSKEPIADGAPIIFTERKDGVKPEYNIRTDRFELAVEATDHLSKSKLAKREAKIIEMTKAKESIEATKAAPEA